MHETTNEWLDELKREYHEDIAIAERELRLRRLDGIFPLEDLLCDIYCIPAHNHQAFYVKVFLSSERCGLLFAKPFFITKDGLRIVMYGFKNREITKGEQPLYASIICGAKTLDEQAGRELKYILSFLPKETAWEPYVLRLDGKLCVIRLYSASGEVFTIAYGDAHESKLFCDNGLTMEQLKRLDELYLFIESIIGNAAN